MNKTYQRTTNQRKTMSAEHKQKISKALTGIKRLPRTKEHTAKIVKAQKGIKRTEEFKKKLSEMKKGQKLSQETKDKMSKAKQNVSLETRKKLSEINKGKKHSKETKKKISGFQKGRKMLEVTKKKISEANKGSKSYSWKGGITPLNKIIRRSLEYRLWREAVFTRDNYTCIWCGDDKGGNLNADHIKSFSLYPELRFAIDNGRTLCVPCHKTTDSYLNNKLSRKVVVN